MPLLLPSPKFSSLPLQDFKFFPWSVSWWKFLAPCESEGLWNSALICPSVMLFSRSLWQGLRHEPGKEGGGKKVSREKQDTEDQGESLTGGCQSRRERREIGWARQGQKRDSCFVLFYFGFGFLVWICFQRWGDRHWVLNPAPSAETQLKKSSPTISNPEAISSPR